MDKSETWQGAAFLTLLCSFVVAIFSLPLGVVTALFACLLGLVAWLVYAARRKSYQASQFHSFKFPKEEADRLLKEIDAQSRKL